MSHIPLFRDRQDAGEQLAQAVIAEITKVRLMGILAKPIVYALPKGGIPVAIPIARHLNCPLDVIVAKKITFPDNPELAIGAVTADGHILRSRQERFTWQEAGAWRTVLHQAQEKATDQYAQFSEHCPHHDPKDAIAILVDDGIATGMTMAVAARALRDRHPAQLFLCAPVAPKQLMHSLDHWGDRIIVLATPHSFMSVSRFYEEFQQVEMEEALEGLEQQKDWIDPRG